MREGFVLIDSDRTESTRETPRPGLLDVQVPADWELPGTVAGGPRRGEVSFNVGGVRRTLSVRMEDQRQGTTPKFTAGEDDQQVGTVEWGGEQVPVYLDDFGYWAFLPAITVHPLAEVYAFVRLGGRSSGDVTKLDRDEVLTVFETDRLNPCVVESYAGGYQKPEVRYLDRQ